MAGESADLIFTDPPYNIDYEGYMGERLKIRGDRMSVSNSNNSCAPRFALVEVW